MISVVIPTYQEADVIEATLRRAARTLRRAGEEFELIVVDDSGPGGDATADRAEALGAELPVRVIRRRGRLGLGSAVIEGWRAARGDIWGAMDADLQHPPEVLPRLARALRQPDVDVAIASRYAKGGLCPSWPRRRRALSRLSTHLAALALPRTLAGVHDPMSGMFLVRARALDGIELRPLGYKILLDVLGRARWRRLAEVPYRFELRGFGRSKLGRRQVIEYGEHLARLARETGQLRTWIRYALVGLSGAFLDVALVQVLVRSAGWRLAAALPVAIELALFSNFAWNRALTFGRPAEGAPSTAVRRLLETLGRYQRSCLAGAAWNAGVTLAAFAAGLAPAAAATAGVIAGGAWNLVFSVPSIWRAFSPPWPGAQSPGGGQSHALTTATKGGLRSAPGKARP